MLKKHMAACLVATVFVAAPALAQTSPSASTDRPTASGTGTTASGSPAMQPAPSTGSPSAGSTMAPAPAASAPQSSQATGSSTNTASGSTGSSPSAAPPPTMAQGSGSQASGSQGGAMQGQFVTQLQNQQVMASRLIGTTVVSANNESIGDVNDVILDRQGQVAGVVIGVGGFLGIGEKDVAVPFRMLELTASTNQGAMTSNNTGAGARPANNGSNVATTGSTTNPANDQQSTASNRQTATTGNTGNAGAGGAAQANANNDGGVPDRLMLRMTKADLQSAPAFQTSRRGSGDNNAGNSNSGSNAGSGTSAPR